jgi:hypothetical protein
MEIVLTPHGEELLEIALSRSPGQSPAQVIENALAEQVEREVSGAKTKLTPASFHAWLNEFTAYSNRIPPMPGETFSRNMIYQDRA